MVGGVKKINLTREEIAALLDALCCWDGEGYCHPDNLAKELGKDPSSGDWYNCGSAKIVDTLDAKLSDLLEGKG